MGYRVVIRLSLNGNNKHGTAIRNKLNAVLSASTNVARVSRGGGRTATYEGSGMTQAEVVAAFKLFWDLLDNPPKYFPRSTPPTGWSIDHVWTYVEDDPCP